ncbi:MAG TPA: hypothetical protein VK829_11035 [Terriglobales bacterium]|nr:hypothetical protein [Terriglobales bacterium]
MNATLSGRPPPINFFHDPLSPPNRIGDGAHGCRNPRAAFILSSFLAARIPATISSTRLRASSTENGLAFNCRVRNDVTTLFRSREATLSAWPCLPETFTQDGSIRYMMNVAGQRRIVGGTIDMGPCEYQGK